MRALFISEKYIKENSIVDENTDYKKILPTIWQCQIQYVQNILGTKLYEDLKVKVIAGTIAGNDKVLLDDYISDCLLYWCEYELQIPLLYEFRNKNVSKQRSNNSELISTKESQRIENRFKAKAQFFSDRLSTYLCANDTLYPLFMTETETDEVKPTNNGYSTNLFL